MLLILFAAPIGLQLFSPNPFPRYKESSSHVSLETAHDQNGQQHKIDFANQRSDDTIYNPHAVQTPLIISRSIGRIANPG